MSNKSNSYILIFVTGLVIGIILTYFFFLPNKETVVNNNHNKEIIIKEKKVIDTFYVDREIYVKEENNTDSLTDTINANINISTINDSIEEGATSISTNEDSKTESTSDEGEEIIITDQLIDKINVKIQIIENDSLDISDELNLSAQSYTNSITVEYWSSPLDLTGYELSKSKLKLFGFNNSDLIEISRVKNSDVLNVKLGEINLKLEKTNRFKTLYP